MSLERLTHHSHPPGCVIVYDQMQFPTRTYSTDPAYERFELPPTMPRLGRANYSASLDPQEKAMLIFHSGDHKIVRFSDSAVRAGFHRSVRSIAWICGFSTTQKRLGSKVLPGIRRSRRCPSLPVGGLWST